MKRVNTVLFFLGLVFLACLVWKIGFMDLVHQVGALGWGILLIILAEGLGNFAHTLGWRHCIPKAGLRIPVFRLFQFGMAGFAINYLTPTASVGGEITKAALLTTSHKGSEAASSVLLDKLMTAIAHIALAVLGSLLVLWRLKLSASVWAGLAIATVLLSGGLSIFLILQARGQIGQLARWCVKRGHGGRFVEQAAQQITNVDQVLKRFYQEHPGDLVRSMGWHLIGHSAALLQAWLFLIMIGQPAPLATVAAAGCLSLWFDLLTFAIPMNLGGLEGSRIVVLKALGCQALQGMAFGVAVRIAQLSWACFGLLSYAQLTAGQRSSERELRNSESNRLNQVAKHGEQPQKIEINTGSRHRTELASDEACTNNLSSVRDPKTRVQVTQGT
jgi:uncharacterized protein (TIRG00374 family)